MNSREKPAPRHGAGKSKTLEELIDNNNKGETRENQRLFLHVADDGQETRYAEVPPGLRVFGVWIEGDEEVTRTRLTAPPPVGADWRETGVDAEGIFIIWRRPARRSSEGGDR